MRLLIYGGLIALFACTSKSGIEQPATLSSPPDSTTNISFVSDRTEVISMAVTSAPKESMQNRDHTLKHQTDIGENRATDLTIKSLLENLDTRPLQEHNITGSTDTTIHLQEGTIIKIPANAFITNTTGQVPNGKVRLIVKEYYSLSDILPANLTTTTKTEILETGGMLYLNAYTGTDTLALKKEIQIRFPYKEKIDGMQLFEGRRDTTGTMIWESLTGLESESGENNTFYAVAEEMPEFPGGYESFARYLRKNINYPRGDVRKGVEGTVYVSVVIDSNGQVTETTILKGLTESLNQAALNVFNSMPAWEPGRVAGKNVSVRMVFPVLFRLDGISFGSSELNKAFRKDLEKNLSDSVLQKADANIVSHYILSSSILGWINCDRFIDRNATTRFRVFIGEENNSDVKLIFQNYKAVLPGYFIDGYYQFDNVPVGEPVKVIAIRAKNDSLTLAINKTTISKSIYSDLNFNPVTVETLKQEIRKLNKH